MKQNKDKKMTIASKAKKLVQPKKLKASRDTNIPGFGTFRTPDGAMVDAISNGGARKWKHFLSFVVFPLKGKWYWNDGIDGDTGKPWTKEGMATLPKGARHPTVKEMENAGKVFVKTVLKEEPDIKVTNLTRDWLIPKKLVDEAMGLTS